MCVLKLLWLLKKRVKSPELTQADLSKAETLWFIDVQSSIVQDQNFQRWKVQFSLFQDESQVRRCGGRLHHTNLLFSSKHHVILSKKPTLAALIAHSAHQRVQHNGVKETLTETRAKYWIFGGRSLVHSVIHKCVLCWQFEGRSCIGPLAPPLPLFCVTEALPFTYTAINIAGPLYLKCKRGLNSNKA